MVEISPNPPSDDSATKRDTQDDQGVCVVAGINSESVLTSLSETLASANAMVSDLAFELGVLLAERARVDAELAAT